MAAQTGPATLRRRRLVGAGAVLPAGAGLAGLLGAAQLVQSDCCRAGCLSGT